MLFSPDAIAALSTIQDQTSDKDKIVFVSGNFNILHPGHLRLLRFASECGTFLVVGVLGNSSSGVMLSEKLRLEAIQSISWVSYGFILDNPSEQFIQQLKPAIVIKGKEHENKYNPEQEIVDQYGGKLLFGSGDISFSSVDLLRREFKEFNFSTIVKPQDFPKRHGFTIPSLKQIITKCSALNVCVIGDTIIDEYINCEPLGMSQEDPTIVVSPILQQKFIGGASIVAAHASRLKAHVDFFSIAGNDENTVFAKQTLESHNVHTHFYIDESRPTTLKQRFRADGKTLLRVSYLRQHAITKRLQNQILSDLKNTLNCIDLLIFADFNYGCLPQDLVDSIIAECVKREIIMIADSQCSSQIGDISRFQHMLLLTPTEIEARLSVRDFDTGLVVLAEKLRSLAKSKNILMTLGKEGVLIHAAAISNKNQWITDRLPAFNTAPKDIAGAGDSMLTCTAMSMALKNDIWKSTYFGSLAAACQVGRLGNTPLSPEELIAEIEA